MARKNKDIDLAMKVAQGFGILILLGFLYPATRNYILGLGQLVMVFSGLALMGMLAFVLYRLNMRRNTPGGISEGNALGLGPSVQTATKGQTAATMIERLREVDWYQFEQIIGLVFAKQGYMVEQRGGANPDGGIDLVLEKAGVRIAVQCKHWKSWNLGVKPVRELLGAMTAAGIRQGIIATLSGYTGEAKQLADRNGIEILNTAELTRMLETTGACLDTEILAVLEDNTKYCPKCGRPMVLRTATKGLNTGSRFWGCSTYPKCRQTMPVDG